MGLEQLACRQRTFEGRSHSRSHSDPLHPTAAALAVAFELATQSFGDAQIGTAPETIHLAGEVGGDFGRADHQQHLVVLMGGRGAPVEAASDDGLASAVVGFPGTEIFSASAVIHMPPHHHHGQGSCVLA